MEKLCIFGALLSAMVLVGCDRDVHVTTTNQTPEAARCPDSRHTQYQYHTKKARTQNHNRNISQKFQRDLRPIA